MGQLFHLEEFESQNIALFSPAGGQNSAAHLGADVDAMRVAFYEQGYKAGWDDASQAAADEQARFNAEFAHNLQDLGFTFHEARSHVIRSLEPLLLALVENLLPELVAKTIAQRILQEIMPLAEQAVDTPIQVVASPANRAVLEPVLAAATTCPLELIDEPSLGPGQVYLQSGEFEKHIDLDSAILAISEALSALSQENSEAFAHG